MSLLRYLLNHLWASRIPYVSIGRMGDVLVFGGVNVYPFVESLLLNAISFALLGIDLS
jgi:hypothetical protein